MRRGFIRVLVGMVALVMLSSAAALADTPHVTLGGPPSAPSAAPTLPSNDPFYTPPGNLAHDTPGAVLRTRTVTVAENGSPTAITATQVLYRTSTETGQASATVATIIRPAVPSLSTKIVSYQTAYDALGSVCDPSYTLQGGNSSYSTAQSEEQIILGYVNAGDTVVVPDYEGEALAWAAGHESGYGTLDGIRATEHLLSVPAAGTPVGMVGYSGGSIATDFAAELAPRYAPELDLVGTAEGGVPVDFFHNLTYINGSPDWSGVIPAVIVGLGRGFHTDFTPYLSAYGLQVTGAVKDQCINNFLGAYPGLTIQKLLRPQYANPNRITPFVQIQNGLIMGRTGTPKGPLFMGVGNADGTGDGVMVAADDEALAHTFCQRGVSVQFAEYSGDTHTNAAVPFEQGALSFLSQRLNGQAVPNGCASIGAGNSLAPQSPAGSPHHPASAQLRYRYLGKRRRAHGLVLQLHAQAGTLRGLTVTLRRRGHLVCQVTVGRLGASWRSVVLRQNRHMPHAGSYTLRVTQGHRTLLMRRVRVR